MRVRAAAEIATIHHSGEEEREREMRKNETPPQVGEKKRICATPVNTSKARSLGTIHLGNAKSKTTSCWHDRNICQEATEWLIGS